MRKNLNLISAVILVLILAGFSLAQNQRGGQGERPHRGMFNKHRQGECRIPDLTDAQKKQIEELRTGHMKTVLPLRNKMGELRAEVKTLSTAEKANMTKINQKIEGIGKVQTQMMKEKAAHRQHIRSLLTEDQRIKFDLHKGRMGRHRGRR